MARARSILAVVLIVSLSTTVLAADIPNGSFETWTGTAWVSSLPSWTAVPSTTAAQQRMGLFFIINGYTATDGVAFGAITNNGGGAQTLRSSTFTILTGAITFDWIYATQNLPGDTTHKDPFTVTLVTSTSQTYTVASSQVSGLTYGTIGSAPYNVGPSTYDTGWRTFAIPTSTLIGQTAYLEFTIQDSAAGGYTSGAFLDNITTIPEPGTLILFGVGFLGVTAFARRRRRAV